MAQQQSENNNHHTPQKSTHDRLISSGIHLFSNYGFDATTTRMIAKDANVNLSAISFYFESKETLYYECLNHITAKANSFYAPIFEKATAYLELDRITPEDAFSLIHDILQLQVKSAFEEQYRSSLKLIYWEQINPSQLYHPITNTIFERVEKTIAKLMVASSDISYENAIIASRFINGAVIAFGEHSLLVQYALLDAKAIQQDDQNWIRDDIGSYCDLLIKQILKL